VQLKRGNSVDLELDSSDSPDLIAGGVYSIRSEESHYSIARLLVVDEVATHVRLYKNRFTSRPTEIDFNDLALGSVHETDRPGIGHLPLRRELFLSWEPELLMIRRVAEEELEGYKLWKESEGGLG
jgi:hypothetical protein